jgi:hypothetical protein
MTILLFPILWSIVAAVSIIWYQRTANDIFWVLAVASAVIGLIWVLVIAHWSIQLLGLLLLLKARSPIMRVVQVKINK